MEAVGVADSLGGGLEVVLGAVEFVGDLLGGVSCDELDFGGGFTDDIDWGTVVRVVLMDWR